MAKNEIGDYDETDANNTDVSGLAVTNSTLIASVDDIVRAQMGALKRWFKGSLFRLRDSTDQTKLLAFDLSGLPAATTTTIPIASIVTTPCGRLSLTTGVAAPSADVVGATTVYYVPSAGHNVVPIYSGGSFMAPISIGTQLSLALDSNGAHPNFQSIGNNYDFYIALVAGVPRLCTGPSWAVGGGSLTARGTGAGSTELELFNGLWVNKNLMNLRYGSNTGDYVAVAARLATFVGSFLPTADGQATDSALNRLVSNAYNPTPRALRCADATATWTIAASSTWQQANNSAANRVAIMSCLGGIHTSLKAVSTGYNGTATKRGVGVAIANDANAIIATSTISLYSVGSVGVETNTGIAFYEGPPGLGVRNLKWWERGAGTDTQTFYGSTAGAVQTGLIGSVLM